MFLKLISSLLIFFLTIHAYPIDKTLSDQDDDLDIASLLSTRIEPELIDHWNLPPILLSSIPPTNKKSKRIRKKFSSLPLKQQEQKREMRRISQKKRREEYKRQTGYSNKRQYERKHLNELANSGALTNSQQIRLDQINSQFDEKNKKLREKRKQMRFERRRKIMNQIINETKNNQSN